MFLLCNISITKNSYYSSHFNLLFILLIFKLLKFYACNSNSLNSQEYLNTIFVVIFVLCLLIFFVFLFCQIENSAGNRGKIILSDFGIFSGLGMFSGSSQSSISMSAAAPVHPGSYESCLLPA